MPMQRFESRNIKLAIEFFRFCLDHPTLRFWQALWVWSNQGVYVAPGNIRELYS